MITLVFDTETTGLPKTKIISPDTLKDWPYIVQFSFVIYDDVKNKITETKDYIVKVPDSVTINSDSIKFHGITNEISKTKGTRIEVVMHDFFYHLNFVDKIVGHNVEFDINMVRVELLRIIHLNLNNVTEDAIRDHKFNLHYLTTVKNIHCTLQNSIELCAIKSTNKSGKEYMKYPKLEELHYKLFEMKPNNLHNSLNDILVTLRCFIKMKNNIDLLESCHDYKTISNNIQLF
jgi:DNA polymerase III epsilon subunit-like protein